MSERRAVFFDFAGTLFSDRALRDVHLRQLRFVGDAIGVRASDDELRASYRRGMGVAYRSVAARPYYRHRELFGAAFTAMAESLGGELDARQVDDAVDRQYQATIEHAELRADCLDTLRRLRRRGLYVQIVSNIDAEQLDGLMGSLGLETEIDAATSSDVARSCKPDPGIYRWALQRAACDPGNVLFVGDSPEHDVVGPRSFGMSTALLVADRREAGRGAASSSPDFVIHHLGQVVEIVEQELVA